MANSKLTDKQKTKIASLYTDGATGFQLAKKFNVSVSTIFNALREMNVEIRPRGRQPQAA